MVCPSAREAASTSGFSRWLAAVEGARGASSGVCLTVTPSLARGGTRENLADDGEAGGADGPVGLLNPVRRGAAEHTDTWDKGL